MKTKPFDCVDMKREAAEKIYQQIKTMTLEEELRFWNSTSKSMEQTRENLHERVDLSLPKTKPPTVTPMSETEGWEEELTVRPERVEGHVHGSTRSPRTGESLKFLTLTVALAALNARLTCR